MGVYACRTLSYAALTSVLMAAACSRDEPRQRPRSNSNGNRPLSGGRVDGDLPRSSDPTSGRIVQLVSPGKVRFTWAEPGDWLPAPTHRLLRVRWDGKQTRLRFSVRGHEHLMNGRVVALDASDLTPTDLTRALGALDPGACVLLRVPKRVPEEVARTLVASKRCLQLDITATLDDSDLAHLRPMAPILRVLSVSPHAPFVTQVAPLPALRHLALLVALPTAVSPDCNSKGTMELLRRLPHLQSLRIEYACIDDDHNLKNLPPMPALRRLDTRCDLRDILTKGHQLPSLRVLVGTLYDVKKMPAGARPPDIREHVFSRDLANPSETAAVARLTSLRILDARPRQFWSDLGPLKTLTQLQVLYLGPSSTTNLGQFLHAASRLYHVSLRNVPLDRDTIHALANLPQLIHLDLWDTQLEDIPAPAKPRWSRLAHLELGQNRVGSRWASLIAGLPSLRNLGLAGAHLKDTDAITLLSAPSAPQVEHLDLSDVPLTDAALTGLGRLTRLRRLHLGHMRITDQSAAHLAKLSALRRLSLRGTAVSDAGLSALRNLENIEWLDLGFTGVTAAGIAHLERLPRLRHLSLESTPITGGGRPWKLHALEYLNLVGSDFGQADLPSLAEMKMIDTLVLSELPVGQSLAPLCGLARLRMLHLAHTRTTTTSASRLCELPRLSILDIGDTDVDDGFLKHLPKCRALLSLATWGSRMTEKAQSAYFVAHPKFFSEIDFHWNGEAW